jgi:hypothetical protein
VQYTVTLTYCSKSFRKYSTNLAIFALWPFGRYGDILGQNHKILLKNQ